VSAARGIGVVDKEKAKSLTARTAKNGVCVFIFGHKGLMAEIGLQGSKISCIDPD